MFISWLGVDVPVPELMVVFSIVVVLYLIIMEFEFRQLRVINRKVDEEETQLGREMRELKGEVTALKEVIAAKKTRKQGARASQR